MAHSTPVGATAVCVADAETLLHPVLGSGLSRRLPLHIRRLIRSPVFQRLPVIDDIARASAFRLPGRRTRVRLLKRMSRSGAPNNPALGVSFTRVAACCPRAWAAVGLGRVWELLAARAWVEVLASSPKADSTSVRVRRSGLISMLS
jgi:hypothetical protein